MPYGVVLKDERRTSNVQHRIKKQPPNTEHSTTSRCDFVSVVLIFVEYIELNSLRSHRLSVGE